MVQVLINRPVNPRGMVMVREDGGIFAFDSTPTNFQYQDVPRYAELEREGQKPLTRWIGSGLRQLSFTTVVASLDWTVSIEGKIHHFIGTAGWNRRVRLTGGSPIMEMACWYFVRNCQVTVLQRGSDNLPSRAELNWTLVEAVDVRDNIIALPQPPPAPPVSRPATPTAAALRTHRVVPGDTLWGISSRYLGNPYRYPEIVALNSIPNPNLIEPGQVFRIPA